jgi:hypothetical protein
MTLPTSGPLSLSDIQTEFGGSNPISLNEYYAGGTYVPAGTTGTNGAVPSSGAISISNFYGTTSLVINFTDQYIDSGYSYYSARAGYQICGSTSGAISAGKVYSDVNGTVTQLEQWITPTSQASNYEVYATYSGNTPSGSGTSSWISCSSNPEWYLQAIGNQSLSTTLTIQVRKISTTTVLDTWNVYLTAESYT